MSQSKKRRTELDGLVKKLYEANATGKLNDRHFNRMMVEYDAEHRLVSIFNIDKTIKYWTISHAQ